MDTRLEKDRPLHEEETDTPARRFEAQVDDMGATYPMLAPAAAVMVGEEDAFDSQMLAGLVT